MKSSSKPSISIAICAELGLEPRRLITADEGPELRELAEPDLWPADSIPSRLG